MSLRYKGGRISATPPTTTGGESGVASGAWTLEQQFQAQGAGNWPTPPQPKYIEDVFSTYLYTGNGSTQTITNGIDLAGKGGLVWCKGRSGSFGSGYHLLQDSARGFGNSTALSSNATDAQYSSSGIIQSVSSTGFVTGSSGLSNASSTDYASWTFRKQPKFFDVVTWSGTGMSVAHSLGTTPATIILKRTNAVDNWYVVHRAANGFFSLNTTDAASGTSNAGIGTDTNTAWVAATSTTCNFENFGNAAGTYVAYLFAHNAGGFGLTGTDNVITCGRLSNSGAPATTVNLGYEPQWLLTKEVAGGYNWNLYDNMEGFFVSGSSVLRPNSSGAQVSDNTYFPYPTATGFGVTSGYTNDMIYIAIRRGPMKVPTDATKVLTLSTASAGTNISVGFPADLWMGNSSDYSANNTHTFSTRLQGQKWLQTATTASEFSASSTIIWDLQNSFRNDQFGGTRIEYLLGRAPSFMDVVCYTGVGYPTALTNTHNLGVAPEMMIVKNRTNTQSWFVYHSAMGNAQEMYLNQTASQQPTTYDWNSTTPSATTFTVNSSTNNSGQTYVAYLFATCAGVSKVGSYTGTGTLTTINCGFTGGARWVLIKRTDSTSDWYVWDTTRGMVAGTDPSMAFNTTAAQTNANSVYTATTGFQLLASPSADVNTSGGSYIFLAIA